MLGACDDAGETQAQEADACVTNACGECGELPEEVCNALDDDCDGETDEQVLNACGHCGEVPEEACNGLDDDCDGSTDEGVELPTGGCVPPPELCNGGDDDGDGRVDEGLALNDCGTCGAAPVEVCNEDDDDCDGEIDEGEVCPEVAEVCNGVDEDGDGSVDEGLPLNDCGTCGPAPVEVCDGEDNDCDGTVDEGLLNACGGCGAVPEEVCNGEDDDCDGDADELVANACGGCGAVPEEVCNGQDDDCDEGTDEGVQNACGACGPVPVEVCNGRDDDCDEATDEGVQNTCGECGPLPEEVCNGRDDDCDGNTDESLLNACGRCGPVPAEECNGADDDCDEAVDEGVLNACGRCGALPLEVCNERDDDCDDIADEGLPLNRCGQVCGPEPPETCDGSDEDCDGSIDEGLPLNACGACGPVPEETCNELDDDCDELTDEGFDLRADPEHCGACDEVCSTNHAAVSCVAGRCVIVGCEAGWRDSNISTSDGCEARTEGPAPIFVDPVDGDDDAVGSEAEPVLTIARGLELAPRDGEVILLPGTYLEEVVVEGLGVHLRGHTPGTVVIAPEGGGPGRAAVTLLGDHTRLSHVEVRGNTFQWGVDLRCGVGCALTDSTVEGVGLADEGRDNPVDSSGAGVRVFEASGVKLRQTQIGGISAVPPRTGFCVDVSPENPYSPGAPATGILLVGARDVLIAENGIERISGGAAPGGSQGCVSAGGEGWGIRAESSSGLRITGNRIEGVAGGVGSAPVESRGGAGGRSAGLSFEDSTDLSIIDNTILSVRGGAGHVGPHGSQLTGGDGGPASAVELIDSAGVELAETEAVLIVGGVGTLSSGGRGQDGSTGGGASAWRLVRSRTVNLRDNAALQVVGGAGAGASGPGTAQGVEIDAQSSTVVVDRSNTLEGEATIVYAGVNPPPIEDLELRGTLRNSSVAKILIRDARDVVLRDVRLAGYTGPRHPRTYFMGRPPQSQTGIGLALIRVDGARLETVGIEAITGGDGNGESIVGRLDAPGSGVGLYLEDATRVQLVGGEITRMRPGAGLLGGQGYNGGGGVGVRAIRSGVQIRQTVIADVREGVGVEARGSVVELDGVTLVGGLSGVLTVAGHGDGQVLARNLIVADFGVAGFAYIGDAPRVGRLGWTLFHNVGTPVVSAANLLEVDEDTIVNGDPRFTSPVLGDYTLLPGSPAIDAGDPAADCSLEQAAEDGSCRLDLGHAGNTPEARAN